MTEICLFFLKLSGLFGFRFGAMKPEMGFRTAQHLAKSLVVSTSPQSSWLTFEVKELGEFCWFLNVFELVITCLVMIFGFGFQICCLFLKWMGEKP